MTTFTATIKKNGTALAASYYPEEWTVRTLEKRLSDGLILPSRSASPNSSAVFSLDSPDIYDREVTIIAEQPIGSPWSAGASIAGAGEYIHPSTGPAGYAYRAGGSGTTHGSTEPTWPTTHGGTVNDNGITWTAVEILGMGASAGKHVQGQYIVQQSAYYASIEAAVGIYSLRRVHPLYFGPAIRVRHSITGFFKEIYFDDAGDLDTATLSAFAGSDSAFVETLYDQSGNGRHYFFGTDSGQPAIVSAGALQTKNSLPAIRFSTDDVLETSPDRSVLQNVSYSASYCVLSTDATGSTINIIIFFETGDGIGGIRFAIGANSTANRYYLGARRLDADTYQTLVSDTDHAAAQVQLSAIVDYANADAYLYQDGSLVGSDTAFLAAGSTQNTASLSTKIGSQASYDFDWTGYLQEWIQFNTNDDDRTAIEAAQSGYWQ